MLASDILFVHIPKAAGGSVKMWASDNQTHFVTFGHYTIPQLKAIGKTWITSFAITRNTYQRMASLYIWSEIKAQKYLQIGRKNLKVSKRILKHHPKGIAHFTEWYVNEVHDFHSQLEYIQGVDILLAYENLNKDFKLIQELTGIHAPLPRSKSSRFEEEHKVHQQHLNSLITDDYIQTIDRLFPDEIEYFGYLPPQV